MSHTRKKSLSRVPRSLHRSTYRRNQRVNNAATEAVDTLLSKNAPGAMSRDATTRIQSIQQYVAKLVPLLRRGAEVSTLQCMEQVHRGIEYFPVVRELVKYGAPVDRQVDETTILIEMLRESNRSTYLTQFYTDLPLQNGNNNDHPRVNIELAQTVKNYVTHEVELALYQVIQRCDAATLLAFNEENRSAMFYAMIQMIIPLRSEVAPGESPFRAVHALIKRGRQLHILQDMCSNITEDQSRLFAEHLMISFRHHRLETWPAEYRDAYLDSLIDFVRAMVEEGVIDIDQQNKNGETVLISSVKSYQRLYPHPHTFSVNQMIRWIEFLIQDLHPRLDIEDNAGHTAIDYLPEQAPPRLRELLMQ